MILTIVLGREYIPGTVGIRRGISRLFILYSRGKFLEINEMRTKRARNALVLYLKQNYFVKKTE